MIRITCSKCDKAFRPNPTAGDFILRGIGEIHDNVLSTRYLCPQCFEDAIMDRYLQGPLPGNWELNETERQYMEKRAKEIHAALAFDDVYNALEEVYYALDRRMPDGLRQRAWAALAKGGAR